MDTNKIGSPRLESIRAKLESLIEKNQSEVGIGKSLSTIEGDILSGLLDIGRLLVEERIGEEEQTLESKGYEVEGKKIRRKQGRYERRYVSVFGPMWIGRQRYYLEGSGNYHALDDYLSLPPCQLSYKLQDWIGKRSTEENYRSSVELLNDILGLGLEASEVKRVVERLAPVAADYYEGFAVQEVAAGEEEGSFLAFGNDGKGVPVVKSERGEEQQDVGRLMKGQKRGVKKQATVAVSFSFNPRVRSSEDILRGLFREPSLEKIDWDRMSLQVHRRAFMCDQKKAIHYAIDQLMARKDARDKPIVALVDCGTGLEEGILKAIETKGLQGQLKAVIADIVHVSEYIWKAANAILGEKYKGRTEWVRSVMKDMLEGKVEQVIKDLRANKDKVKLKESAEEQLAITINYLDNHKHKMQYKAYLEKGYPISTGLIESTCGHLVKDRMEDSGMRWTITGAQQMLDLRAVHKNGDWNRFMTFVQQKNKPDKIKMAA